MARRLERLTAKGVASRNKPGYHADGGGLYLQVSQAGTKSWIFRFARAGKAREMGLGALHTIDLADARVRAQACRQLLLDGFDPIVVRDQQKQARAASSVKTMTFSESANACIKSHKTKWTNAKHAAQWIATLDTYAMPTLGHLSVSDVDTGLVLKVLEPIWSTKHETATRLRQRIEAILNWAKARGHRTGENPARLRGHLDNLLPTFKKAQRVTHHAALPYAEVGGFVESLRKQEGIAARALEFAILTAARTGEVIGATWNEIDLDAAIWVIPASRMKAGVEHKVPLSDAALGVLRGMQEIRSGDFVFPGAKESKGLSNMSMLALLKRMGRTDLTVHGFRSSFRDWCSERTNYPREVCEKALAHAVSDAVEAAYRRGDLFSKRRRLMVEWAKFCDAVQPASKVLRFQTGT